MVKALHANQDLIDLPSQYFVLYRLLGHGETEKTLHVLGEGLRDKAECKPNYMRRSGDFQ